jgi:hypothetical protein
MNGKRTVCAGLLGLLTAVALAGPPPLEIGYRKRIERGPKLRFAAATYFGGAGAESFAGVVCRGDGTAIAYGNAWGIPSSPAAAAPVVLGPDAARDLPLFAAGMPGGDWPHDALPSAYHPNRTGFLVAYSPDLAAVTAATRFGCGVATVDAAVLTSDGTLITAGSARQGFDALAKGAGYSHRLPPAAAAGYGTVAYGDVTLPGDVYVAAWRPDFKGFAWVWVLEKHVNPPAQLFVAGDGRVAFECRGLKVVAADGRSLQSVSLPAAAPNAEDRFLAGAGGSDGGFLFAGWTLSKSGSKEWMGPLVERRGSDGALLARYYDWRATLACQPTLELKAMAGITCAELLPNGHVLVGAPCALGRSVLERSPVDIATPAARRGLLADEFIRHSNRSVWGAPIHWNLARFDPANPSNCTYQCWSGISPDGRDGAAEELTLDGLRATAPDRVAVWGMSGGALLRTVDVAPLGTNALVVAKFRRRPLTPYLTVFGRDFGEVLWSGLLPRCRVSGVAAGPRGLLVAATCRPTWKYELFEDLNAPGAQPAFGGGYSDGRVLLLEEPK